MKYYCTHTCIYIFFSCICILSLVMSTLWWNIVKENHPEFNNRENAYESILPSYLSATKHSDFLYWQKPIRWWEICNSQLEHNLLSIIEVLPGIFIRILQFIRVCQWNYCPIQILSNSWLSSSRCLWQFEQLTEYIKDNTQFLPFLNLRLHSLKCECILY